MQMIAAVDENWGIGKKNELLVSIPADMKFFREMTTGCTVIMGRKTLESFPGKRPLPNRRNIVLTQDAALQINGAEVVHSVEEALLLVEGEDPQKVFCIGGESIYRQFLPYSDTAYITKIDHSYDADAHFPDLDRDAQWEIAETSEEQTCFDLTYHFVTYRRVNHS